ncbi:hypothetical protein ACHAXH_010010 [Discostella pseudostelligera]
MNIMNSAPSLPLMPPSRLSPDDIATLLERVDAEMESARDDLEYAETIAQASGLTVHSSILDAAYNGGGTTLPPTAESGNTNASSAAAAAAAMDLRQEAALALQARHKYNPMRGTLSAYPLVLSTTGGHCNTDHVVPMNPDGTINQLSEYKRMLKRRFRQTQNEERGADRWDLPRIPGGRRRRIKRAVDAISAPPEPPQTGYVIYVSQMTTKIRHDNPHRAHNQIAAIRWISSMWNELSPRDRTHYVTLAKDARVEYEERLLEYRATGSWSPYTTFTRLMTNKNGVDCRGMNERSTGSSGPWVRIPYEAKNALEKEIETYEQVIFPPRPVELEEVHEQRLEESKKKRKEKRTRKLEEGAALVIH